MIKGFKHSEETKEKIRQSRYKRKSELGYINSPSVRKKMSKAHKGVKLSIYHRKKQSDGRIGDKHWNWKGGKREDRFGYVYIYQPNHPFKNNHSLVFEHRLVMEKHLGRYLKPKEVIHHINHNPSDNRIENLMLFVSNSEHHRFHWSNPMLRVQRRN